MNKQIVTILVVLMAITLASAGLAGADPVQVINYDVEQTPISGFGCWSHTYDGTIVDTGRIDTVSVSCTPDGINHIADYNGGSGTLNDGVFGPSHLFLNNRLDSIGNPIVPVITLHLANTVEVTQINVFGGNWGDLTAATVEINGVSASVPITSVVGSNGVLNLTTTPLAGLTTTTIVLRDFVVSPLYGYIPLDQFSLTELTVDGITTSLPVPVLKTITISPATAQLVVGGKQKFTAYPKDQYGKPIVATIKWASSDTSVGTVDVAGIFTSIAAGTTTITASDGDVSGTATVTVTAPVPEQKTDVTFKVTDIATGRTIEKAKVSMDSVTIVTNDHGIAVFKNVDFGKHNYYVTKENYLKATGNINVIAKTTVYVKLKKSTKDNHNT